jgi:nucleoside-diphosphate-sugar epimerase
MKKVLVVGGAGYIGGGVTDCLIENKIPFAVYDNLTYEHHYLKPVEFIYGDIRDTDKLKQILPDYSHVIWLAALVGDPACAINPALTKEINQDSVKWLAENFDGRILFTSTCSVYGANDKPVTEESDINPLSVYAQTKYEAEQFLKDKDALIFRLGTAFGVSDTYARIRMDLAVNVMTMNALRRGYLDVFGGTQWRPFVHVKDIARFLVNNLDTEHRGIYNIATENITINELAKKIQQKTGCEIKTTEQKFQDNRNYNADTTKALQADILPTDTEYDIDFGIEQVVKIVNEKRVNDLDYDIYSNVKRLGSIINEYSTRAIQN